MPASDIKNRLINKIKETNDPVILEEVSALLALHEPESVYEVSDAQKKKIEEAKEQVKKIQTLSDEQADKDTDEWLSK
jgi:hypothetical protein